MAAVQAATLLKNHFDDVARSRGAYPVLDLACGSGRNGRYLVERGLPVTFADRRQAVLDEIGAALGDDARADYWQVDLELEGSEPLAGRQFGAILVFRYLYRPLLGAIRDALAPGGLVLYETYTVDQPRFGRPRNPDFLLRPGELAAAFEGWEILHGYEGICPSDTGDREQAIAQIVARKPA